MFPAFWYKANVTVREKRPEQIQGSKLTFPEFVSAFLSVCLLIR